LQVQQGVYMFKRASRPYRTPSIDLSPAAKASAGAGLTSGRQAREALDESGKAFLAQMSGKTKLELTASSFPHILNRLSPFAYQPSMMVRALDQLLIDDRTHRQGFPFDVLMELGNLRELYGRFLPA
jgi:hypothetical protein